MKTIFGYFDNYQAAQSAVDSMIEGGFDLGEMNVLVQAKIAKRDMNINQATASVEKTEALGRKTLQGLDALVAGEQPIPMFETGDVYAAGDLATVLASSAKTTGSGKQLGPALIAFGVPESIAEQYVHGVANSGVLFWIRTSDEDASRAAKLLRHGNASYLEAAAA